MQAASASASSEERSRGLLSAMKKGGDQSAKKARLENVPAEQVPTMEACVKMDLTVLNCPICFRPFKPPVFQCNGGHVACSGCRGEGELPGNQCQKCEHGGDFGVRNTAMDAVVSSVMTKCQHDGCGHYVTYHKAGDHQSVCPHAPCRCMVPGCCFVGTPRALLGHLNAVHSKPLLRIQYGKVLHLQGPVSEPWLLLLAEEDDREFIVVGGAVGLGAPTAVSVVCIRAGASPPPHYTAKVWANGPPSAANGKADIVWADMEVTSSKEPGRVAFKDLTFLTVPPKLLAGAGPSRTVSLNICIDKITS